MSVAGLQSDSEQNLTAAALAGNRARGGVSIAFQATERGTSLQDLHEWGGFRAKLPRVEGLSEAVLINTGGGLLGGDCVSFNIDVQAGAAAQVCTQAAERIYRSLGPACEIDVKLDIAAAARLHWLPQETILFDRAHLARSISADIARDGIALIVEAIVFGRAAMDERVSSASLHDRWRIRRDGRLIYADTIAIDGDIDAQLSSAAIGHGAKAMATILYIAPDAEERRDGLRATLEAPMGRAGVSAWNGMCVARLLAPTADALKADIARTVRRLSGYPLPRVWGAV